MGACATKPGDLKAKVEAPLVVEDAAAAPVVASEEKAKADGVPAPAEADQADAGRRRSLSDLLKQDAETSDGEAVEKAVAVEPATSAAGDAGATTGAQEPVQASAGDAGASMGAQQEPVHASVATTEQDGTADELKDEPRGDDVQAVEEEKRVDPDSVQVAVPAAADAPSAEERKVADDASA